ncbi:hypothetical protein [Burkholderia stabilis]|uniref:hypothetical protein n=1 Tax=Burkholderia stabilis TaxID=95485 RepID=UPI0013CED706|nr:hypothetical protein [Burkholderia stabilis]
MMLTGHFDVMTAAGLPSFPLPGPVPARIIGAPGMIHVIAGSVAPIPSAFVTTAVRAAIPAVSITTIAVAGRPKASGQHGCDNRDTDIEGGTHVALLAGRIHVWCFV